MHRNARLAQPATLRRDPDAHCRSCPVRGLDVFGALSESQVATALEKVDHYAAGARVTLYRGGEKSPFVYVVRSGLVKLAHYSPAGDERIVRILKTGDAAGLEAMFGDAYHHTAVALIASQVCRVPVTLLEQLDRELLGFHRQMLRQFQRSLNEADAVITDLSTGPAHGRVARLLLFLARDQGAGRCTLIGREDMGAILGITTESASRIIAEFRRAGILRRRRDGGCDCDLERLTRIGCGLPA